MAKVMLVVKSKIKEAVSDLNVASDVPEALNEKVLALIKEASARTKANGRRTLQARDL